MNSAIRTVEMCWPAPAPDWVRVLAERCDATGSQREVAKTVGYSPAVVSHILRNSYTGNLANVEARVRGALLGETVACPVLGEISRDACLDEQKRPFSTGSGLRVRLHRACRSGCPNSRLGRDLNRTEDDDDLH